jgi:hypothetical protein
MKQSILGIILGSIVLVSFNAGAYTKFTTLDNATVAQCVFRNGSVSLDFQMDASLSQKGSSDGEKSVTIGLSRIENGFIRSFARPGADLGGLDNSLTAVLGSFRTQDQSSNTVNVDEVKSSDLFRQSTVHVAADYGDGASLRAVQFDALFNLSQDESGNLVGTLKLQVEKEYADNFDVNHVEILTGRCH